MGNFDENYEENYPFSEESHYHDYCIISVRIKHNVG